MFEHYASRLQENPELRPILQIAASQQLGSGSYTPGRYVRVQFRPDDVARIQGILQSLTPDFLEVVGEHPQELYRLTPAGLAFSSAGPRVSELTEALLLFLRARLAQNPTFGSFTWDDLKRCAAVTGDGEFDLVREVLSIMRLSGGGTATLGTQPSFTYGVPDDIEQLRAMATFDELFELRQHQHEQRQKIRTQAEVPVIASQTVTRYPTINVHQRDVVQEKLRALRQHLADLEPYPWDPVEAWIASACPLIKAHYGSHFDYFRRATVQPRVSRSPDEAARRGTSRQYAISAKKRILSFVDGLLDLPGVEPAPPATKATRTMSKDRSNILDHEEILDLRGAVISARLSGSRGALLAHIPADFAATLPVVSSPGEQVLMDLDALNMAGELIDGSVPLAAWLRNAIPLCGGQQEEKIFAGALKRVGGGSTTAARSKARPGTAQEQDQPAPTIVHHHHGDTHMGDNYKTNITGSTVGAFAQGHGAVATGQVTVGAAGPLTQEQHKTAISAAQTALVHDQDALERIDDRLYEALGQFLTLARKIQVEQQSLAEVQAQMKATLDEVWAQQEAKGMKPKLLPKGLEVVEALAKSPITAEIAKKLLGA